MNQLLTILLLLTGTVCYGQTQVDMNKQAYAKYQKADQELNEVYKKILGQYKADKPFITNLKASQRIWVTFRDAELRMKFPDREGNYYGSLHPVCRANYLEELTCQRIDKLREWLTNPKEGEGCAGSVQAK
ncbi:DUF1311 domain-containing protein [Adhaeribacter swui]|uniref:DUF1311 domain-containing protein n=1 Tax=Adhaeribacter swui TaxID=2086471 RepID=A0A7G7GEI6_9BACT|nr:lysozyme inhibitor LprI family protein [Adhaeribacter swui]QNF35570.1 DUF1311 domain-containing protein [Adhaeribacter swui]